ncbi:hypothetical protein PybrP1_002853 [[Pythium] brassicae (nom. inval.)]|nr:hypothetical protein PybrP1_002853 [[Pythium] brassicae (nom. inval.)]
MREATRVPSPAVTKPVKEEKLVAPVSALPASSSQAAPEGPSTGSSSASAQADDEHKLTTYVNTTAALSQLVKDRGAGLFDRSEFPVVALDFHVQQRATEAPAFASEAVLGTWPASHQRPSPTHNAESTELLAISITGLPTTCCTPLSVTATTASADSVTVADGRDGGGAATLQQPLQRQQLHTVVLHLGPALDRFRAASLVATLLEDSAVVKVVHGVHAAAFALSTLVTPIRVANCVDLQLAFEHVVGASGRRADVAKIARHCGVPVETAFRDAVESRGGKESFALSRECSLSTLQRLRARTVALLSCYRAMFVGSAGAGTGARCGHGGDSDSVVVAADSDGGASHRHARETRALLTRTTTRRWDHAVANRGVPSVWFDPAQDYAARSFEYLETLEDMRLSSRATGQATVSASTPTPQLSLSAMTASRLPAAPRLECDLDPLLALLPDRFRRAILAIDGFRDTLVDICLDVGRLPHVYVGKGQRISLVSVGASAPADATGCVSGAATAGDPTGAVASDGAGSDTVTKADVDEVLANLGGPHKIGFDNRAGIDRQLHRISVMRSKTGEVYGLTLRVGRALEHAANVLQDVLMSSWHRDKSVLLLGRPGCGKTTLIRDVARSIAATRENVCIIDTSNEIGGDGLVPHTCVGWARRMMVPSLEEQASVMIECVQNHTVETLVIDEIGRRAEVLAAATVRQRGPRLIASGHGNFRSLLKNPDLKGLVGGVQQVLVGDAAAAKSAHGNKLQHERAGAPIFDIIIELDHVERGHCRVIWDAGAAVDAVLRGEEFACEERQQDLSVRGILVP